MNKSLYPEIAKMLGVELGEEFKVDDELMCKNLIFKFTEHGLDYKQLDDEYWRSGDFVHYKLDYLLSGYSKIIKLPFKPKLKEMFWRPVIGINRKPTRVENTLWLGTTHDLALLALGMVYRTKEEAEAHLAEDYKKLTGKELAFSCPCENAKGECEQ